MPEEDSPYVHLNQLILETRFLLRGGFHVTEDDLAPDGIKTLLLIGNAGPALFDHLPKHQMTQPDGLDAWTKEVLTPIADAVGGAIYFPFDGPPYYPFLEWARKAEPVHQSPIGLLLHPRYGLWHAYRAAIGFKEEIEIPDPDPIKDSPCETCEGRPCLTSCPVDAFRVNSYDVERCAEHLRSQNGADCVALGCRSRRACPVGQYYRYTMRQSSFHMAAFLRNR